MSLLTSIIGSSKTLISFGLIIRGQTTIIIENREAISVFEIFDTDLNDAIEKKQKNQEEYDKGIFYYNTKNFQKAILSFQQVLDSHPEDLIASLYLKRAKYFQKNESPPDWEFIEVPEE